MTDRIHCDGSKDCLAPLTCLCICNRCEREGDDHDARFHACANAHHRIAAEAMHAKVFGRDARWAGWLEPKKNPMIDPQSLRPDLRALAVAYLKETVRYAHADVDRLVKLLERVAPDSGVQGVTWEDVRDEWSDAIKAAHPTRSDSHEQYGVAMKMVGHRHSKVALVELVNWLLVRITGSHTGMRPGIEAPK